MSKKASRILFYLIHCVIAFVAGTTIIHMYFEKFVNTNNSYLYFVLEYAFLCFCVINFFVIFFSYRLLKLEKGKKFYPILFINYIIANVCSYLTFYFAIYVFIFIRLMIYGLY